MHPFHGTIERIQCPRLSETLCVKDPIISAALLRSARISDVRGRCASSATDRSHVNVNLMSYSCEELSETHPTLFAKPQHFRTRAVSVRSNSLRDSSERLRATQRPRTILNHNWVGPESSLIWVMKHAAIKGKTPKMRLRSLYLPVRCTIHLRRVPTVRRYRVIPRR
jgi:hypothetical protein